MGSIDRYIFRTTLASFALILVSLTGVIWITQALRGIDLMTSQGQTIVTARPRPANRNCRYDQSRNRDPLRSRANDPAGPTLSLASL